MGSRGASSGGSRAGKFTVMVPFNLPNKAQVAVFLKSLELSGCDMSETKVLVPGAKELITGRVALDSWAQRLLKKVEEDDGS